MRLAHLQLAATRQWLFASSIGSRLLASGQTNTALLSNHSSSSQKTTTLAFSTFSLTPNVYQQQFHARRTLATEHGDKQTKKGGGGGKKQVTAEKEELDEDGLPIDYKTLPIKTTTRRLDHLLMEVTKKSRTSLEKLIAEGSVRVKNNIMTRRSYEVNKGCVIEIFIKPLEDNENLCVSKRVVVHDCTFDVKKTLYMYELRIWKEMITDNWRLTKELRDKEEQEEKEREEEEENRMLQERIEEEFTDHGKKSKKGRKDR